jgi:ribosome production factor 1
LTSDPAVLRAAAERAATASKAINGEPDSEEEDEGDDDEEEDEEMPEAGPSTIRPTEPKADEEGDDKEGGEEEEEEEQEEEQPTAPPAPPKIMITTSPSPCKLTYQFCDELKNVFPGGQFFKRPRGKGFELGRLARWGIKRGFGAVIVVNEDHKQPSESGSCSAVRVAR